MQLYQVTEVIDGDTFTIDPPIDLQQLGPKNRFSKVRLANINAVEIGTPKGKQATLYLKGLIEGKRVTLKPIEAFYDHVVADVWRYPNKLFVSAMMVYSGYASWKKRASPE